MMGLYLGCMLWSTLQNLQEPRAVAFAFFEQWSEAELEEINFFIVGPHWYFRPHMGLLTICAKHYEGLFWLVAYYATLATLPLLSQGFNSDRVGVVFRLDLAPTRDSTAQLTLFVAFVASLLYVGGTLPCARFYYEEEDGFFGNSLLRLSYQYIYLYLIALIHVVNRVETSYRF